jgi:hypothetical protein
MTVISELIRVFADDSVDATVNHQIGMAGDTGVDHADLMPAPVPYRFMGGNQAICGKSSGLIVG